MGLFTRRTSLAPSRHPALELIDRLTGENRADRSPARERELLRARHEAFEAVRDAPGGPVTPAEPAAMEFAMVDGLPVIGPDELDAPTVRAGILAHGCLLVRGLVDAEDCRELIDGIDRSLDARERDDGGPDDATWFDPFVPATNKGRLAIEREWVNTASGIWTADSPRMLFELTELFERTRVTETARNYLGERPALSVNKCTLRRVPPGGGGAAWHQDGAFLGSDIRALNIWLALTDCGERAPGMDLVPSRIDHIVETGTEGARFDWSVSPAVVERVIGERSVVRPSFEAGDALLFDHLFLHRTASAPEMTKTRYAIESWCFAPSAYPSDQIPLIL